MATILDVARHAGVSMKTVSRVLNNEAHVRPVLRAKVEVSVNSLGYRPNLAARQLAGQRSFIVAYPFNNASASYVTQVLMGAARACRDRGYHLVSEPVEIDDQMLEVIQRLVETLRPDGMILTPPLCDMVELTELISRLKVPLVRVAGGSDLYGATIVIDDQPVSKAMVAHLVALGHSRIGFVLPHPSHIVAQARYQGYLDGLSAAGVDPDLNLIMPGWFDVASGEAAARALLDLPHPPTAIFAANDHMALGVLKVANRRGMKIPCDLAIAGFDDSPASILAYPALTTVQQPTQQMGAAAAMRLLGEQPDSTTLQHRLIIRGSTDPQAEE